ncbi:MAG: hypothetical protein ACXWPM_06910 [Bdellovibrionota bacterium]
MRELAFLFLIAILGLALFGDELPGFEVTKRDPVVELQRTMKFQSQVPCASWITALETIPRGTTLGDPLSPDAPAKLDEAWGPWAQKDLLAEQKCEAFPCSIKFNRQEIAQLRAEPPEKRHTKVLDLVLARSYRYEHQPIPEVYEFPQAPQNPFVGTPPGDPQLWARTLILGDGQKVPPIRQILERRFQSTPDSAKLSMRATYSDHYFDGWGEVSSVSCDAKSGTVTLNQRLSVELDLLKKRDLISLIAHGRMRSAIEEQGEVYLNGLVEKVRTVAERDAAAKAHLSAGAPAGRRSSS